jgi:hypothetical protein
MNALRAHLTTLVNEKQTLWRTDLAYPFKKMVLQRFLAANILAFLIQYIGLRMSSLDLLFTPVWIASGTAGALIFLRGPRILPGIWLGSAFAYYFANSGPFQAILCASVLALQAYVLLRFSYRFASPTLIFYQRHVFIRLSLVSMIVTAIISYFLTMISYSTIQSDFTWIQIWLQWWFANFNGLMIFACAIITWDAYFPQTYQLKKRISALVLVFGALVFLCLTLLFSHPPSFHLILVILLFLLTLGTSITFKWCGIITALFVQGLILNIAAFCVPALLPSHFPSVLYLQLFIFLEIIFGLFASLR